MKMISKTAAVAFLGILSCSLALADAKTDMIKLMQDSKAAGEKAKTYMDSKRGEMKALDAKIDELKASKDPDAAKKSGAQMEQLMAQKNAIELDIAKQGVEFSTQQVDFSQRHLKIAQDHLAELQTRSASLPKK